MLTEVRRLLRAPRRILSEGADLLYAGLNQFFKTRPAARHRAELRAALSGHSRLPFVMIAVPNTLHFLIPCFALARRHVPLVVLGNGLRDWEEDALASLSDLRFVRLPAIPGWMIPHHFVVESLLRDAHQDFALHDPDLYIFNPAVYAEMEIRDNEMAVGAFGVQNAKAGLSFPATNLVTLRVSAVRGICERYAITPRVYRRTPRRLVSSLRTLGIGDDNFPKDYLSYYDLLNLVWMMGLHDGHRTRILWSSEQDALHIGGVSYKRSDPFLDYVHSRFLEFSLVRPIAPRYRTLLLRGRDHGKIQRSLREQGLEHRLERMDERIERISATLGEV